VRSRLPESTTVEPSGVHASLSVPTAPRRPARASRVSRHGIPGTSGVHGNRAATCLKPTLGVALIAGVLVRWAAFGSAARLAWFAIAMAATAGLKSPLEARASRISHFSAPASRRIPSRMSAGIRGANPSRMPVRLGGVA
jgi:hypothetical protein